MARTNTDNLLSLNRSNEILLVSFTLCAAKESPPSSNWSMDGLVHPLVHFCFPGLVAGLDGEAGHARHFHI